MDIYYQQKYIKYKYKYIKYNILGGSEKTKFQKKAEERESNTRKIAEEEKINTLVSKAWENIIKTRLFQGKLDVLVSVSGFDVESATENLKNQIINENDIKCEFYLISSIREAMNYLKLQPSETCISSTISDAVVDNEDNNKDDCDW